MPATRPRITVLIPTFNRANYLVECLESILAQRLPACQIIVINDRSTDNTAEVLGPYMKAIEYVETDEQLARAGALNEGLDRTVGDYVWTFDDDDVALPDALERFVGPLEAHPEHGYSYSTFYYTATRTENDRIGEILGESQIPDLEERGFLIPLLEANYLCGAALFARTACYRTAGYFDPTLLRSQDYELGIRFARQFTGIRVPGPPTFHYRQHEGLRGTVSDRFTSVDKLRKWLEYDQITFGRLYRDLPLVEYLPPGGRLPDQQRQAYLQRMAVMASKLLIPEIVEDLGELARLSDRAPLSPAECRIVDALVNSVPFYREGSLDNHFEVFDEVRRLARSSPAICLIRAQIRRSLAARQPRRTWRRNATHLARALRRGARLYLPPLLPGNA